jgi:hypothetical protein
MPDSRPFLQPHYYDETFKVRLGLFLNMPFWGSPVIQATDGTLVCPGFSGSTYMQNAWDYVIIGDSQTPGLATVNSRKVLAVDRKKPATKSGQRNTTHGTESAEAEISIMIWTPDQLQQLQKIIKLVFPVSDQRPPDLSATDAWPQAFNVQHP